MVGYDAISGYVSAHQARLLDELLDFLRIPSVSTLPEHKADVERAAEFTAAALRAVGLPHVEIIQTAGHPLVYAESLAAPGKPTVLCYGHYDVQPPDPLELWNSPPFEPVIANGNIYARGSADDKGQFYTHIKAIEALRELGGALPLNVKFLIEGEEEIGGKSVAKFVAENPEKLKADVALVSDTALYAPGLPTLTVGLRGLVYMEVEATGPSRDLHSGLYGGAAPNAVYGLVELLAKAKDDRGTIQIPGIYDSVAAPSPAELESWASLPYDEAEYLKEVGSSALTGEPGRSTFEKTWARPTFEVPGSSSIRTIPRWPSPPVASPIRSAAKPSSSVVAAPSPSSATSPNTSASPPSSWASACPMMVSIHPTRNLPSTITTKESSRSPISWNSTERE